MTAQTLASGAAQVAGAALAPLLPGVVQAAKARLQGRRGPGIAQPYRELRRLWGKGSVRPAGTTAVYRLAPAVVAASLVVLLLAGPGLGGGAGLGRRAGRAARGGAAGGSRGSPSPSPPGTARTASRCRARAAT